MAQHRPPKSDHVESGLVQRVRKSLRQLSVPAVPYVLLACSGGKDSVALASILAELQRLKLLTFSIAHINHGQHDQAELAANAVSEIGVMLNVPVSIHRLQQHEIDVHKGVGLEEAMRRERYVALAKIAAEQQARCIALAHHQTDQAETILLHLMRGAGMAGLTGMRTWEQRRVPWWSQSAVGYNIALWRPLLGEASPDVAVAAMNSGLPVVEDPTNTDLSYRRNAVRHQLLPVLEGLAEGATAAIARSAEIVAGDVDLLEELTEQSLANCLEDSALDRATLMLLPRGMQRRVIRAWILGKLPHLELSAERIDAVIDSVERNRGGSVVQIGSGYSVALGAGRLTID